NSKSVWRPVSPQTQKIRDNQQQKHETTETRNKSTGIDSILSIPNSPNITIIDYGFTDEVVGGMDGGYKEKTTNLQNGVTKGGCLTHVLHEGLVEHRTNLRDSDSQKNRQQQEEKQQQQSENEDRK
ncbi:hypothetical protein EJD97_017665, partial [Solanum chilense]